MTTNPTYVWVAYDPDGPTDHYSAVICDDWIDVTEEWNKDGRIAKRVTIDEARDGMQRYCDAKARTK